MKVSGTATLSAPVEAVWSALHDPAVLVRTIPGCLELEQVGPDRYRMTVAAGVASIKGTYVGEVALTDKDEPSSFLMRASGSGAPGTVSADVRVSLATDGHSGDRDGDGPGGEADNGATLLRYDADAVVGGPVGGVGQRVLTGVAKKTAGEFFRAVDDVLTGRAPAIEGSKAAGSVSATQRSGGQPVSTQRARQPSSAHRLRTPARPTPQPSSRVRSSAPQRRCSAPSSAAGPPAAAETRTEWTRA